MWTPATWRHHSRAGLRCGGDLTDAEWAILAPFLPAVAGCGRKQAYAMRETVNAISTMLRGGIAWRLMPDGFPPWARFIGGSPGCAMTEHGKQSTITWSCVPANASVVRPVQRPPWWTAKA